MTAAINPRVLLWLRDQKLPLDTLERCADGTLKTIPIVYAGQSAALPWTVEYMRWIQTKWGVFARCKGFRDSSSALLNGATHEEFDAWLVTVVGSPEPENRHD